MIIAVATNDHNTLIQSHFGDAAMYDVYDIESKSITRINSILNHIEDTEIRQDKAIKILKLLNNDSVELLANKAFGTNILVISQYVLPLIYRDGSIPELLLALQKNIKYLESIKDNKNMYISILDKEGAKFVEKKIKSKSIQ